MQRFNISVWSHRCYVATFLIELIVHLTVHFLSLSLCILCEGANVFSKQFTRIICKCRWLLCLIYTLLLHIIYVGGVYIYIYVCERIGASERSFFDLVYNGCKSQEDFGSPKQFPRLRWVGKGNKLIGSAAPNHTSNHRRLDRDIYDCQPTNSHIPHSHYSLISTFG